MARSERIKSHKEKKSRRRKRKKPILSQRKSHLVENKSDEWKLIAHTNRVGWQWNGLMFLSDLIRFFQHICNSDRAVRKTSTNTNISTADGTSRRVSSICGMRQMRARLFSHRIHFLSVHFLFHLLLLSRLFNFEEKAINNISTKPLKCFIHLWNSTTMASWNENNGCARATVERDKK